MEFLRITSESSTRIREHNQFSQLRTKLIPTKKTEAGHIFTMTQGEAASVGSTVLRTRFCSLSSICLAASSTRPNMTAVFQARPYGRFIEIKSNFGLKKTS